jgi:Zn-dependent peptidase ImmA (M78 family)
MKAIRTDTRCDFRCQIPDSRLGLEASEQVFSRFQTCDVFEIAEKVGVKIVYQKWFPVTLGEFDWRTKTIIVNENAPIAAEKIIAHELGHYFLREFDVKNVADEENFCDEFANELLKEFHAEAQRARN